MQLDESEVQERIGWGDIFGSSLYDNEIVETGRDLHTSKCGDTEEV